MTASERMKAMRERMKAQGLVARTVYFPKDEPPPTQEEVSAFLAWRKENSPAVTVTASEQPQSVTVTPSKIGESVTVTPPAEPTPVTVTPQPSAAAARPRAKPAPVGEGFKPSHQEAPSAPDLQPADRKAWGSEAQGQRDRAVKREIKRLAQEADHSNETSRTEGLCTTLSDFLEALGPATVKEYLQKQGITHDQAEAALYPDHRRRTSIVLLKLEKAGIWE
jgi:hypothetical protein